MVKITEEKKDHWQWLPKESRSKDRQWNEISTNRIWRADCQEKKNEGWGQTRHGWRSLKGQWFLCEPHFRGFCVSICRQKKKTEDGWDDRWKRKAGTPKREQYHHWQDGRRQERQKDLEEEICVITWNVNKSSAQYDSAWHGSMSGQINNVSGDT